MDDPRLSWFDLSWFAPDLIWNEFEYEHPIFRTLALAALVVVPGLFVLRFILSMFFGKKFQVAMLERDIRSVNLSSILAIVPPLFMTLFVSLVLFALSRPQKTEEQVENWSEGIDISLVLDISRSMELMDFRPNRLAKVKEVAKNFIAGRESDQIGIVLFAGQAFPHTPPTTDYAYLKEEIDRINFELIEMQGTAIGNAIQAGTKQLKDSESKSKVMILLSDGENTVGNVDPLSTAELAHAYDIKIYTIAIGKEGKVLAGYQEYRDFFTGQTRKRPYYTNSTLDESTLRKIAKKGNGEFFRATNSKGLEKIFSTIDEMEKSEILEKRFKSTRDFYHIYLIWALLPFFAWLLTKSTFLTNALLD